MIDRREKGQS
jgi:hypothetical protein